MSQRGILDAGRAGSGVSGAIRGFGLSLTGLAAIITALSVCAAFPTHAGAEEGQPLMASVARMTGKVRWTQDGKSWQFLNVGDVLRPGALVQTATRNSTVDILLGGTSAAGGASANLVRLYEDSVLVIKKLDAKGRIEDTELELRSGQMLGSINRLPSAAAYNLEFPGGFAGTQGNVAGALGTIYVLKSSGALTVLSGTLVVVLTKDPANAIEVKADHQFDPATGQVSVLPANAPERKLWSQGRTAAGAQPAPTPATSTPAQRRMRIYDARGLPTFPDQR